MTLRELITKLTGFKDIEIVRPKYGPVDIFDKIDYQIVVECETPHLVLPLQRKFNFSEIKNVFVNHGSREIEIKV